MLTNDSTVICRYPGRCKNHPITAVLSDLNTQTIQIDSSAQINASDSVKIVSESTPLKVVEVNKIEAIDTIKPFDVSLLNEPTYTPLIIHRVRKQPEMQQPMHYDILINSLLFVFMAGLTVKYALTCSGEWVKLFNELKKEIAA